MWTTPTQPQSEGVCRGRTDWWGDQITVYSFYMELKIRMPKFRKRTLRFTANGIGYCAIQEIQDHDIWVYEERLPRQYRQRQNVSLDGETVNLDSPEI